MQLHLDLTLFDSIDIVIFFIFLRETAYLTLSGNLDLFLLFSIFLPENLDLTFYRNLILVLFLAFFAGELRSYALWPLRSNYFCRTFLRENVNLTLSGKLEFSFFFRRVLQVDLDLTLSANLDLILFS